MKSPKPPTGAKLSTEEAHDALRDAVKSALTRLERAVPSSKNLSECATRRPLFYGEEATQLAENFGMSLLDPRFLSWVDKVIPEVRKNAKYIAAVGLDPGTKRPVVLLVNSYL